jgi:hypothetical protein
MNYLKNEKGMALGLVLLVITVGIILITGMMTISLNENKQAIYQTNSMKAYYIARAGADAMVHRLLTIDKEYWDDFTTLHNTKATNFGDGQVEVSVLRTGSKYEVVATGKYNEQKREAKAVLLYNPYTRMEYAIYTKDPMVDIQLGALNYPIGSGGTIDFKNPSYENLYRSYAQENVIFNPAISEVDLSDVQVNLTPGGEILLDNNGEEIITDMSSLFAKVELTHSDTLWTIDTSNADFVKDEDLDRGDISMIYDNSSPDDSWMVIWLSAASIIQGDIEIIGDNNLMIIVEDKLTVQGTLTHSGSGKVEIHVIDSDPSEPDYDFILTSPGLSIGGLGDEDRLGIYLWDDTQMDFDVNGEFYGFIIGPDADVDMKNPGSVIHGAVYCNIADIDANVQIFFPDEGDTIPIRIESIQFSHWE